MVRKVVITILLFGFSTLSNGLSEALKIGDGCLAVEDVYSILSSDIDTLRKDPKYVLNDIYVRTTEGKEKRNAIVMGDSTCAVINAVRGDIYSLSLSSINIGGESVRTGVSLKNLMELIPGLDLESSERYGYLFLVYRYDGLLIKFSFSPGELDALYNIDLLALDKLDQNEGGVWRLKLKGIFIYSADSE